MPCKDHACRFGYPGLCGGEPGGCASSLCKPVLLYLQVSPACGGRRASHQKTQRTGDHDDQHLRPASGAQQRQPCADRKSTRLNSSHLVISYAVFCLKKKKIITDTDYTV